MSNIVPCGSWWWTNYASESSAARSLPESASSKIKLRPNSASPGARAAAARRHPRAQAPAAPVPPRAVGWNAAEGGDRHRAGRTSSDAARRRADEPTTALDVTVQAQILDLLAELQDRLNMAMILVSHDLAVVATRTDRIIVMYAGQVVEHAPTRALFRSTRMPYTEALIRSIPRASGRFSRSIASPDDPSSDASPWTGSGIGCSTRMSGPRWWRRRPNCRTAAAHRRKRLPDRCDATPAEGDRDGGHRRQWPDPPPRRRAHRRRRRAPSPRSARVGLTPAATGEPLPALCLPLSPLSCDSCRWRSRCRCRAGRSERRRTGVAG